jgi:hypothetical protein
MVLSPTPATDDTRTEFLNKVSELVDFWDKDAIAEGRSERLAGLAYSMLYLLSGTPAMPDIKEDIHERWGELRYGMCPA